MKTNGLLKTKLIAIFIAISTLSATSLSFAETIEIKNCNDLEWLWAYDRTSVYELANDIDCRNFSNFRPIGTPSDPFTAIFDGRGHTISQLQIGGDENNPVGFYEDNPVGLFGVISGEALIIDVHLKDSSIIGKESAGALVGEMRGNSSIENVHVTNTRVWGTQQVGGLVGKLSGASSIRYSGVITEVAAGPMVVVQGADYIGGLVGRMQSRGTIGNSYADASVAGKQYIGGLVGQVSSEGSISHSYASSRVEGTRAPLNDIPEEVIQEMIDESFDGDEEASNYVHSIGGLVGGALNTSEDNPVKISHSYASGDVIASIHADEQIGGLVGETSGNILIEHTYYAQGRITLASEETGLVGGLVGEGNVDNIVNSYWDIESSGRETLTGRPSEKDKLYGKSTAQMQDPSTYQDLITGEQWNFNQDWAFSERGCQEYPYPALQRSATTGVCISTAADIDIIRNNLDGVFRLVNDIDLSSISNFEPIGSLEFSQPFTGLLNANGHTISHLSINLPAEELHGGGFFAYTDNAVITRLYLSDANVQGVGTLGVLVGIASNTLIEDVGIIDANIQGGVSPEGFASTGALAGMIGHSTIRRVHTHDTGNHPTTGIVGEKTVGGLIGYATASTIHDVYNEFNISSAGQSTYTGGIIGALDGQSDLSACYNNGRLEDDSSSVGALVGLINSTANDRVTYCYWNTDINPNIREVPSPPQYGTQGGSTNEMQTESFFKNNGANNNGIGFFFVGTKTGQNIPAWVMPEKDYPKLIFSKYR